MTAVYSLRGQPAGSSWIYRHPLARVRWYISRKLEANMLRHRDAALRPLMQTSSMYSWPIPHVHAQLDSTQPSPTADAQAQTKGSVQGWRLVS